MGAPGYGVSVNHIAAVAAGVARPVRDRRMVPGAHGSAVTIPRCLLLPPRPAISTRSEDAQTCAPSRPRRRARGSKPARPPIAATDRSACHSNNAGSPATLRRDAWEGPIDSGREAGGVRYGAWPGNRLILGLLESRMRAHPGRSPVKTANLSAADISNVAS
jgi:hypothetical protein